MNQSVGLETIDRQTETILEQYIHFSTLKNGFLKQWIENFFVRKNTKQSVANLNTIFSLIFMSLIAIRCVEVLTIQSSDERELVYLGSIFYYLGGHHSYGETVVLLWTINFIVFCVIDIRSELPQYEWTDIFAFLSGIMPYSRIGNSN